MKNIDASSLYSDYFARLAQDREETARILEKTSVKGIKKSVVDKYSDQAHFIYELLQNADDVLATKAKFVLDTSGLAFIHNGKINFSISDPDSAIEEMDSKENRVGHLNSITSIANSNKYEASIGKFGVGFKAVFQYTNTPHIYDPLFKFKIVRFIVPQKLTDDYLYRTSNETIFYFPFDLPAKPPDIAFNDILEKLKSLINPLLFLENLDEIIWEALDEKGKYSKKIKETKVAYFPKSKEKITYELINLIEQNNGKHIKRPLWLFTRMLDNKKLSTGFFLNKKNKIEATSYPAFCFFPTKETTNLKFIVQAPFLLTESREGIKAGEEWNRILIQKLAELAACSIPLLKQIGVQTKSYLIDDDIISIMPYKSGDFSELNNKNKISFLPFYTAIKEKFQNETILPSKNGSYTGKDYAFWASDEELTELFSDKQIAELIGKPGAKWVFVSLGRKAILNEKENYQSLKATYIDSLVGDNLDPDKLLRRIDGAFIEKQSFDWLNRFYIYLNSKSSYQTLIKKKAIFIDKNRKAHPAFDDHQKLTLFLPTKSLQDYPTIHENFLSYPTAMDFFKSFGIGSPNLRDEIYNKILPQYHDVFDLTEVDKIKGHFLKIFNYFLECPNNHIDDYVNQFKEIKILLCKSEKEGGNMIFSKPSYCYYPTDQLIKYFENKTDSIFVDVEFYIKLVDSNQLEKLKEFLIKIGVQEQPIIFQKLLDLDDEKKEKKNLVTYATRYSRVYDKFIDGSKEIIKNITAENSVLFWTILCQIIKKNGIYSFKDLISGKHEYYYGKERVEEFISTEYFRLTEFPWLLNREGEFSSPHELLVGDLASEYDIQCSESKDLIAFLHIQNPNSNLNLTAEQKMRFELGEKLYNEGINASNLQEILQIYRQKKNEIGSNGRDNSTTIDDSASDDTVREDIVDSWIKDPIAKAKAKIKDEMKTSEIPTFGKSSEYWETDDEEVGESAGELMANPIVGNEYKANSQGRKKDQLEKEIEVEIKRNRLIELADHLDTYSFGWFKTLLELEDNFTAEERLRKNPVRVVFGKAEKDKDDFLILSETPYIPPSIEDLGIISLQIFTGDEKTTIEGEIISPQKHKLKIKLTHPEQLNSININLVTRVVVQSSSPDFVLEKLKTAFGYLGFDDNQNLKDPSILPSNIKFVFGPPGTGKTTFLSWMIGGMNKESLALNGTPIIPLMEQKNKKVLVLTPTNKAADVIVEKIIENYQENNDFPNWLIRFGETKTLDKSDVFVSDRNLQRWVYSNVTLVTTIARFPYDYFDVENKGKNDRWYLKEFDWDVIVFDEASMIQQAALLFVVYYAQKRNPDIEFIIGGDPFQIPPIFQFEYPFWSYLPEPAVNDSGKPLLDSNGNQYSWKNDGGNIYSFVGLTKDDSFTNPQTEPHPFVVHNLPKQFRSITPIGELYSNYRYGGKLQHDRTIERISQNPKIATNDISIAKLPLLPINIIHFPVKKYGGVYKQQGMKGSPYHIYSAIFAVELIRYIQSNSTFNETKGYKIGIISPYAKQNLLISKLLEKIGKGKIETVTGTVHGFQGDQCDLVIVIFNPPKNISRSPRSFLNKKNIINVAISRAKDKMIILTPFDPDKEIDFNDLHQISRVKWLAKNLPECKEHFREFNAMRLEQELWGHTNYIEDICTTSSHQEVNIYTQATKRYEIRFDENAMDVQVKMNLSSDNQDVIYQSITLESSEILSN